MDHLQQKQISADLCAPKMQPGTCALIGTRPDLSPQLESHKPPLIITPEALRKQSGLSPNQPAVAPSKATEQAKPGFTPATLASISRPRPTALGTKPDSKFSKPTRISVDPSKDIDLIPVCIPGPQSASVRPHSPTESCLPLHSPQSPQSPLSYTNQPYLSPTPSLPPPNPKLPPSFSPKSILSPQPQRTPSSGSATLSQVQSSKEKPAGDNNDFRWDGASCL